jgi:regulator of cell morphogenesis and NO signaling
MMQTSNSLLSAPLQQLKAEHVLLRTNMDIFYDLTEEIEFGSGFEVVQLFAELYEQISDFNHQLKLHAKREDEGLFPMMARRLGENDRTIETMEFEHKKADQHLQDFLTEADQVGVTIDETAAKTITVYAVQAYATLTQHFAKEEKVLFPMAENILSVEEKDELEQLFKVDRASHLTARSPYDI